MSTSFICGGVKMNRKSASKCSPRRAQHQWTSAPHTTPTACCMYHPVIKQKWNGEMTLLVADVALGECKDLGYGSQSCPNDDFDAWCEEGANRAQCGKAVAEDKRLTPSRPPILQVTYMQCDTCAVTHAL